MEYIKGSIKPNKVHNFYANIQTQITQSFTAKCFGVS